MSYGYYPGCSLTGTAKEFDLSLKAVLNALNIDLQELADWSCCGASSAHVTSHLLSVALPARNLSLANKQGLKELVSPCAACYNRLVNAQHQLKFDEKIRIKVEEILEDKISDGVEIINLIQLFQKVGLNKIIENKKVDLSHLNAACYYGCLLVRPNELTNFDDEEEPTMMEEIVASTGAKSVAWNFKTECCGAAHSIAHTEIVEKLSKKIIDNAAAHGANVIIVACPMCHSNLDMRQINISRNIPNHNMIPILYLSELVGLALGIEPNRLGLNLHFIDPMQVINKTMKEEVVL